MKRFLVWYSNANPTMHWTLDEAKRYADEHQAGNGGDVFVYELSDMRLERFRSLDWLDVR